MPLFSQSVGLCWKSGQNPADALAELVPPLAEAPQHKPLWPPHSSWILDAPVKAVLRGKPAGATRLGEVAERDDEVYLIHDNGVQALGNVRGDINVLFGHYLDGPRVERRRRDASAHDLNTAHPIMTGDALSHGTPAGIPCADKENTVGAHPALFGRDHKTAGRVSLPGPTVNSMRARPFTLAPQSPREGVTRRNGPPSSPGNGRPSSL